MPIPNTRLQVITDGQTPAAHIRSARLALRGGCRWIQLRIKDCPTEVLAAAARELMPEITACGATLIIDDDVQAALNAGAHGVHLGIGDMSVPQARELLGPDAVIGATAHNYDEAMDAAADAPDYLGIGPYRYTVTKRKLAPVLGPDGLRELMTRLRADGMLLPVLAVGGITEADIPDLLEAGVDRVAVAGAITRAHDPVAATTALLAALGEQPNESTTTET